MNSFSNYDSELFRAVFLISNKMGSQNLPDTQPFSEHSQREDDPLKLDPAWGRLDPVGRSLSSIPLINDNFTFGRSPACTLVVSKENIDPHMLNHISKKQFIIEKKEFKHGRLIASITDLSSNGTYINGKLVGQNKSVLLANDDNIAVVQGNWNVFVFVDLKTEDEETLPAEIRNYYVIYQKLGEGGFGEVRYALQRDDFNKEYAVKILKVDPIDGNNKYALKEVMILKPLNHPNILRLENVMMVGQSICLFLEFMKGGDLGRLLYNKKTLPEDWTKYIFYQILKGVEYLHSKKVVHRDLKPANILLSSETPRPMVKIGDFGLSKVLSNNYSVVKTLCGTMSFSAPEISIAAKAVTYSKKVDNWSLGVILYVCISGILPFSKKRTDISFESQIRKAQYDFLPHSIWIGVNPYVKMLIKGCLCVEPDKRMEIYEMLHCRWFSDVDPNLKHIDKKRRKVFATSVLTKKQATNNNNSKVLPKSQVTENVNDL